MCFNMVSATYSHKPRREVLPCPVSCLSDDTVLSFVLPCRMNGPGEEKRNLRPLTLVLSRLLITGIGPGIWWVLKELNLTANHPTYYGNGFTVRRREQHPCFGVRSRIRTDDFNALQALAFDHSAILTLYWLPV